jgi:hypothetical protein
MIHNVLNTIIYLGGNILTEIEHLLNDITVLKNELELLIINKNNHLQDKEVIEASHKLNEMLNQYNRILHNIIK